MHTITYTGWLNKSDYPQYEVSKSMGIQCAATSLLGHFNPEERSDLARLAHDYATSVIKPYRSLSDTVGPSE